MRKNKLFSSTYMSRGFHRGVPIRGDMRGDTGGGGGGESNDTGNNNGNSGDSKTGAEDGQNNAGQKFTGDGFWEKKVDENGGSGDSNAEEQNRGKEFGQQLMTRIDALNFDPVFSAEIAADIADGKLDGVNQAMLTHGRNVVKQAVAAQTQVLQMFGSNLMDKVTKLIDERLGGRDDDAMLLQSFPSAKDPKVKPIIERVFKQALLHTDGDRAKAVSQTRDMLKIMGSGMADDLGLRNPPGGPDDNMGSDAASALVEELLSRN